MRNQEKYVTITHYKEREFYFLNHAIQTNDGFIVKEIEQFHESEKEKLIERIRLLQSQYPNIQIASVSLTPDQKVTNTEDKNRATAKIFDNNYVVQEHIDLSNIPTTLYFSPFAILYEEYKKKLDNKLTLLIGLFDRKLYMMFATNEAIHQSWVIGTRGLSEKQVAERVYKSMKAYYKIAYKFADHIEMLVTDESPKLLKVLREELSLKILPTQNNIHNLLHHMAGTPERASSSYIKATWKQQRRVNDGDVQIGEAEATTQGNSLDDIRLSAKKEHQEASFFEKLKLLFGGSRKGHVSVVQVLASFIPILFVVGAGSYFSFKNDIILKNVVAIESQIGAQNENEALVSISDNIFTAMGKSAELKKATISTRNVDLTGIVWGIEPLRNSLDALYTGGEFIIKPLENFMTEFSFKSKI
ncbi:MAG: hypothetical protein KU29_03150 [Sulfurovum sp. FS06-10]|nr:MAG: hypothetical protein KU29_03150 [Sulfurovum sp. FS06-10]